MHEEMQDYKIILTWEALYDVTDIADYIEEEFGQQHADRFQSNLKEQMQNSINLFSVKTILCFALEVFHFSFQ